MSNQYDDEEQASGGNPPPDDFANFDPAAYVRKHREQEGQSYLTEDLADEPLPSRGRGRRRVADIEEDPIRGDRDEGDLGLGAALLGGMGRYGRGGMRGEGGFRGGRRLGLLAELIGDFGPTRRIFMFVITVLLFLACVGVAAIAYVISLLTRR